MAENPHSTLAPKDEIKARIEQERRERQHTKGDQFRAVYSEWLRLRAEDHDPRNDGQGDEVDRERSDRIDELARKIVSTPSVFPYMIFLKFEVLEIALGGDDGTAWNDNRELMMLAGIKADLQRFTPGSEVTCG